MRRRNASLSLLCLAACGGGGGLVSPVQAPARLAAADVVIPANADTVDVLVELAASPDTPIRLLQVAVELPPGLALPATGRLQAVAPLVTLDGDVVEGQFVVTCGDARNASASPLQSGSLFRLRVQTATPRQPGTFTLRFLDLRAATADGNPVPASTSPTTVDVRVE